MFCKIVAPSADICKLPEVPKTFEELQRVVLKKFSHEIPEKFSLKYKDSDEELITVSNDDDLHTAILTNQDANIRTLRVFVLPQTNPQGTQGGKAGPRPSSPGMESSQKINHTPKIELRPEEPYIGQLDYISSDPGKVLEESADLRTIYEQMPPMIDLRRSVSHNPQMDLPKNKDNALGGNYFGRREYLESPVPRLMSPIVPEEVVLSGHFNESQIKAIMGAVEKKVREQIEDKIKTFSDQILSRFQEELWNMNHNMSNRAGFEFGNRGMLTSFGSKMNMKRGTERRSDSPVKLCNVCRAKIYGILYSCLVCKLFICCEKCESTIEHEHPLLKIRPAKGPELYRNDSTIDDRSYPGVDPQTQKLLNMLKRTSSYIENSSHMSSNADRRGSHVLEPLPALTKMAASQYVPKPDREQGTVHNFAHTNHLPINKPFMKSSTVAVLEQPASNASGGSPTGQNHNKLLGYKVAVVKPPLYEVTTVRAGYPYNISFTIKNNGELRWPENTKLVCVEGLHKGSDLLLPELSPGETHVVNLHLEAPWDLGRYFNEWKIHYTKDRITKSFGKEISIEIDVVDGEKLDREKAKKEKQDRIEKEKEAKQSEKNAVVTEDHKLMKEFGCSEQTLKNARVLQDLMCNGSLKEKIEFINSCKKEWDLNQIVSAYMSSPTKLKDMIGGHATPN